MPGPPRRRARATARGGASGGRTSGRAASRRVAMARRHSVSVARAVIGSLTASCNPGATDGAARAAPLACVRVRGPPIARSGSRLDGVLRVVTQAVTERPDGHTHRKGCYPAVTMTEMLFVDVPLHRSQARVTRAGRTARPDGDPPESARSAAGRGGGPRRGGDYRPPVTRSSYDVVVVGGGTTGWSPPPTSPGPAGRCWCWSGCPRSAGAAVSQQVFEGVDVRLSAYSYLVSLLPDRIVADLGLEVRLRRPRRSPPTRPPCATAGPRVCWSSGTRAPPRRPPSGSSPAPTREFAGWQRFYGRLATLAEDLAPTLTEPLLSPDELAGRLRDPQLWHDLRERPLADVVADHLSDDVVRGRGPDRRPDRHLRRRARRRRPRRPLLPLPPGRQRHRAAGGCRSAAWARSAAPWRPPRAAAGRSWSPGRRSPRWNRAADGVTVHWTDDDGRTRGRRRRPRRVRRGADRAGRADRRPTPGRGPSGSQLKINMVLARLPRLRSGADPATAFAGTFHVDESAAQIDAAYAQAAAGRLPDVIPFEVYCHSLTDPSILGPVERATGAPHADAVRPAHPRRALPRRPGRDRGARRSAGWSPSSTRTSRSRCWTAWPATPPASPACRPPRRWTSRRRWPCRAGTSSTATWPGRSRPTTDAGRHLGRGDRPPADRRGVLGRHRARRRGQRAGRLRGRPPPAGCPR